MKNLAIVIPAYKSKFFVRALDSIASQTNKNFTVYIGDDHSPEDLKAISDRFAAALDIQYTRFPDNIGAARLVEQWNRCIALTQGEEWLWLFSDDDLLDPTCVASFYQALADSKANFDVYRFNTCIIDADDKVRTVMPVGPIVEPAEQMAYHLLLGERGNSMPDHIFSRRVYEQYGGFVFTPYAQGADWAMSMLFSQAHGLYTIPDARVYWRLSGTNISSVAADRKSVMLSGHLDFIEWVLEHFSYLKEGQGSLSYDTMARAALYNLELVVKGNYKLFDKANARKTYHLLRTRLGLSAYGACEVLLALGMHTEFWPNKLYRLNKAIKSLLHLPDATSRL